MFGIGIISSILIIEPKNSLKTYDKYQHLFLPLFSETPMAENGKRLQKDRLQWELDRLANPETGKIPNNIRRREIVYANKLQEHYAKKTSTAKEYDWISMGPYNVGGRTRAFAIDISNENVLLAGGVSGGLWRSVDQGESWAKVTAPSQHQSITCIIQDTRPGKTNNWYYGSGESYGNSASESFWADYLGNGIYKSTDGGITWNTLSSTVSGTPQDYDVWDLIWRIAIDPSIDSADILYAAAERKIYRSGDGGSSWTEVLSTTGLGMGPYTFTDVAVTSEGVVYATVGTGAVGKGIWRSGDHGITWVNISNGSGWPSVFNRIVIGINPVNENSVYFLANTPGSGQHSDVFFGGEEWNSLWKYQYITGDGANANGKWTNLSSNIPAGGVPMDNFNAQDSYNLVVAVKPDDTNTVFIGGTNLYRSIDGFTSPGSVSQIGGYNPGSTIPFYELYPNHHPDNHALLFVPSNPDIMLSATDGGVFKTMDCTKNTVVWTSLDNGYKTSQFYTIGIDHGPANNDIVFGGLQDNGTFWTNSPDPTAPWTMPSSGDGSHCAVTDGGQFYYFSRQNGKLMKATLDENGVPTAFRRIDPIVPDTNQGGSYLFINPFILDPSDNNTMYLCEMYSLWRNDSLDAIPLTNEYDTISQGWTKLTNTTPGSNAKITTIACSKSNPAHRVYYGANNRHIYRLDSANTGNPTAVDITNNIDNGGFTACIAIDPRDADKVLVVYANYEVYSLYYTMDGGDYWMKVAGNLETGPSDTLLPSWMVHLGDGPSCRWASIIPMGDSTLYLLGTSVGLFTTDTLIADSTTNDSTKWIPQAANSIGNIVVEMIDYRESDGFVAIGTHGNGVYTSHLWGDTTSIGELSNTVIKKQNLDLFPNPTQGYTNLNFELNKSSFVILSIYDKNGKKITNVLDQKMNKGNHSIPYDTNILTSGIYLFSLETDEERVTKKVLVL